MNKALYESDFNQWLSTTVELLESGSYQQVDWNNLIEEVKGLGQSEKRAVRSNMIIVMLHLLKYIYQPDRRTDSWTNSIFEHRLRLELDLADSPNLKNIASESFLECYQKARKEAAKQTKLDIVIFPEEPPFSLEQVLGDWMPWP